jgi:hypothetical protein
VQQRRDIEKALQKNLWSAMRDGMIEDHATLVWAGIKHVHEDMDVDDVLEMIDAHNEDGGDFYADVFRPVVARAILESKLLGKIDPKAVARIAGTPEERQHPVVPQ